MRVNGAAPTRTLVFALALVAIATGVAGRMTGLDHKIFWQDEAFSMLRITGHDEPDLYGLFDGRVHPSAELLAIDRLDPQRGFGATLASLREEPQRGPLFYLAARLWADAFGDGVTAMRVLPALLGWAGIALAFFLGRRVAGGTVGGTIFAALVAIAPIELHLSQQVREYVAVTDAILASSWLLLRAFERPTVVRWIAYATGVVVGLFTSPIFIAVVGAHGAVAAVAWRRDGRRAATAWLAATVVAAAIFAPWLAQSFVDARAHAGDLAWLQGAYPARSFALKWAFNIGAVFFDAEFADVRLGVVIVPILVLVAVAVVDAMFPRKSGDAPAAGAEERERMLALALAVCSVVPLVLVDALRHAHFESVTRYQTATWIGIDLLVARALARAVAAPAFRLRACACGALFFLAACGTFCAVFDRSYAVWWDDNEHLDERLVGRVLAAGRTPALVAASKSAGAAPYALVLARYVPAGTLLLLYDVDLPPIAPRAGDTYLFVPRPEVLTALRKRIAPAHEVRNVSPPLGLILPDLRSPADPTATNEIRAENALWKLVDANR